MIYHIFFFSMLFLFGVSIGSFLNAFEYRLHQGIDFVKKRSFCPKCGHVLGFMDLVPVLSFLMLGGKCRYCGKKISWQYPIVEFLSGGLFLLSGYCVLENMSSSYSLFGLLFAAVLAGLVLELFLFFAVFDVKYQIIPNKVIIPAIICSFVFDLSLAGVLYWNLSSPPLYFFADFSLFGNMAAGILGGAFIAAIIILTNGKGMGGGDMKMMVFMGFLLGWRKFLVAWYVAILLGALLGLLWGGYKGKIRGQKIPFGLFLSIGSTIAFLWGEILWRWGLKIFNF